MDGTQLSDRDMLLAELYGLKVCLMCLLYTAFKDHPDRERALRTFTEAVSDSIDVFQLPGFSPPQAQKLREAMRERALSTISAAANPELI